MRRRGTMDSLDSFAARLKDRAWRLANLYWITDKSGARVRFVPNCAQVELAESLGRRNVDLKVRQLGITTGYCILWLDACLFSDHLRVRSLPHTKPDAKMMLQDNTKFAYDNLPPEVLEWARAVK